MDTSAAFDGIKYKQIEVLFKCAELRSRILHLDKKTSLYDLLIAIAYGKITSKPFDIISLAAWAGHPRTSCQRDVKILMKKGLVSREKNSRAYQLIITPAAFQAVNDYLEAVFNELSSLKH